MIATALRITLPVALVGALIAGTYARAGGMESVGIAVFAVASIAIALAWNGGIAMALADEKRNRIEARIAELRKQSAELLASDPDAIRRHNQEHEERVRDRDRIAAQRVAVHDGTASSRPLSARYESIGLAGEIAFAEWAGIEYDRDLKPHGTNAINATINGQTINVLTARKPTFLIVEEGKLKADLYVLCHYREAIDDAVLIGWATRSSLLMTVPWDVGGHGIKSHAIRAADLMNMSDLRAILELPRVPQ